MRKKLVIDANKSNLSLGLAELLEYRELFWLFAVRDFKIRFAQTFLGVVWVFVQPISTLIIFTIVFGRVAEVDTKGIPYPVFAMCGMSAWTYFSFVVNQSAASIISAQGIIKKIYFPRLIIPMSKGVLGSIDFMVTGILIIVLMVYYGVSFSSNILFLPIFLLLNTFAALGIGIWLSALSIRFRDFQQIVPFMLQVGIYITPVAYMAESIAPGMSEWMRVIYFINPMVSIIEGFRWSILGIGIPFETLLITVITTAFLLISGLYYFKKVEKLMADII